MAFKFFHRLVTSFQDVTHNFEQLEQINPLQSAKNLSDVGSAASSRTNLGLPAVAHGTTSVVFTAGANTPEVTVAHGLASAPHAIVCPINAGTAHRITAQIDSLDATNLKISGWADANISQTVTVAWIAVA